MKRKGLFLDRDGVINEDREYVHRREDFIFMPGVFPFLRAARDAGWRLVIVTNQSGVARGMFSPQEYAALTEWMLAEMKKEGVEFDMVLSCFYHPAGSVVDYRRGSYWRKPNPGMIMEAAMRLGLDLPSSAMIGDSIRDMEAAEKAGIANRILLAPQGKTPVCGAMIASDFAAVQGMLGLSENYPVVYFIK